MIKITNCQNQLAEGAEKVVVGCKKKTESEFLKLFCHFDSQAVLYFLVHK